MANVNYLKNRMLTGEISPLLLGRADLPAYANGVQTLENFVVQKQGGITRRNGTKYVAAIKTVGATARLIPFVYNLTTSYVLEFSNNNIRVYKDGAVVTTGGTTPVDITTTYTTAQISELSYCQDGDTLYIAHSSHVPRKLTRSSDTAWTLADITWSTPAFDDRDEVPSTALTLSAKTVGSGRTVTSAAAAFIDADVGRNIYMASGALATITAFTSATEVTAEIKVAFASTTVASGSWSLSGGPNTTCSNDIKEPVGATVTLSAGVGAFKNTAQYSHVGKFVSLNGGVVEITGVSDSPAVAYGIIRKRMTTTSAAAAEDWSVNENVWTSANGYPRAVTVFEQRLCLAGSTTYPRTVWGSTIGEFENFALGTGDSDAFSFTIPVEKGGTILHLVSTRVLQVLTYGGEITVSGGNGVGVTPTNVQIRQQTAHGTKLVRPFKIGNEVFFVQRSSQKLRSTGYNFTEDSYKSNDLTLLSDHITSPGLAECSYAQEPDGIIWAVRTDGSFLSCTYDKDQQIQAWARQETDGIVESVTSVPYGTYDQVWMLVRRTINGSPTRYIEIMAPGLNTDCAHVGTDSTGKATWTGLSHLEGCTVDIVADGVVMPQETVVSGSVTLPRTAKSVEIGLHYDSTMVDMPVEIGGQAGTAFGENVSVNEIVVRLYASIGLYVNGEQALPFRAFGASVLDEPLSPFTGDKKMINLTGWENGGVIMLQQLQPLPCTVLATVKKVTVNFG